MLAHLLDALFPAREDERVVRAIQADTLLSLLAPELVPLGAGFSAAALLPFADERVRAAIHEAKYRGTERAFALLAAALAEYLREAMSEDFRATEYVLVPVPLGTGRRRERGYNQVEEIARRVARELRIEIDPTLLARTRETVSQVSLPRHKRLQNMRAAFACPAKLGERSGATTYILLDDVLTTGATLSAACSALSTAGAETVLAVALAH